MIKRILVFGMTENPGGVETFLLNYYRNIDKDKLQFDFLCNSHRPVAFEEEIKALGGRTFHIMARSRDIRLYRKELEELFKSHKDEWSCIWVNVSSLANIDYLKIAKRYGIPKRIIHSHASGNLDNRLRGMLHKFNRKNLGKYATDFWACSDLAAKWFFTDEKRYQIIQNAIDVDRVCFDADKRNEIRLVLGIGEETMVIGHVGRLHFEKNQSFAIDVFHEFLKTNPDARLVLVGEGPDEGILHERCSDFSDKVIFAGVQRDMQAWLSAFDVFLFPSIFEGLGIAALEAQANGLPVLASAEAIPSEVKVTDSLTFLNLELEPSGWADRILGLSRLSDADEIRKDFRDRGYDITTEAGKLERLLLE